MTKWIWQRLTRLRYMGFRRLSSPIRTGLTGIPVLLILAAILFPVFCQPHTPARRASCMSNLKQISTGMLMYAQDYDEMFPVGTRSDHVGNALAKDSPQQAKFHAGQGWAGLLFPYTKNYQVLRCPQEEAKAVGRLVPVSYAYNRNIALHPKQSDMKRQEATVLLAETSGNRADVAEPEGRDEHSDANTYSAAGNGLTILAATDGTAQPQAAAGARYATGIMGGYGATEGCPLWPLAAPQEMQPRHNEGAVFAFADGHVKWIKPAEVSPGDNAADPKQMQDCATRRAAGTANLGAFKATFSTK